jgi:hypothetical protein
MPFQLTIQEKAAASAENKELNPSRPRYKDKSRNASNTKATLKRIKNDAAD